MTELHGSYLRPFFYEMNKNFAGKWCVLHSYETLPAYSDSDVDMAFNGQDMKRLKSVIHQVANASGWRVYQEIWYNIQSSIYFVLKHDKTEEFLAIDFLIDTHGIGDYGFSTAILTKECTSYKGQFPIPTNEMAFCYKLVKRIVKRRSLTEDDRYLMEHYRLSNHEKINSFLTSEFGAKGKDVINAYLNSKNKTLTKDQIRFLNKKRDRKITTVPSIYYSIVWETKRIWHRIIAPCGVIITIPKLSEKEAILFLDLMEKRVNILFRFVRLNPANSLIAKITGFVGSTLVICPRINFDSKKAIRYRWSSPNFMEIDEKISVDFKSIDTLVEEYYSAILKALLLRKHNKIDKK